MDLNETIRQLRAERARLEAAIAQLRSLAGDGTRVTVPAASPLLDVTLF